MNDAEHIKLKTAEIMLFKHMGYIYIYISICKRINSQLRLAQITLANKIPQGVAVNRTLYWINRGRARNAM